MSLMGVDVGTTGVKAVVFDESGRMLASAYEEYPLLFPFPGAAEIDSRLILAASHRVIARAASEVSGDPVSAIGIASQGEAFTPISEDGRFLANVMTSSDSRAAGIVEDWSTSFGAERLYRITGHTPYPMYSLYKMLWLKQNQPQAWEQTRKFLFTQDLVAHSLTGEAVTDCTMAARSMLFDVRSKSWSPEILDAVGLSEEALPRVVQSGGVAGVVKRDVAEELGIPIGATVSVCGHDQPVGALGCGAAAPGKAAYSIGTVECVCPAVGELLLSDELMLANLASYPHTIPNAYTTVAFNMTGGSVLRWVRDNLATEEASDAQRRGEDPYAAIIAAASNEPSNVVLLPHLGPTGTPHFDAAGAGVFFGLKLSTSRGELLRSVLEGITYEMKWNLSILEDAGFHLSELRAIGGGAKSDAWMQIKSDILGLPLTTMKVTEATCMGAAILAASGVGRWEAKDAGECWALPIRTFEPRPEFAAPYEARFAIYKELYLSLGKARRMLQNLIGEKI